MNEGYIILPRAIVDEEYFSQKFTRAQALIDLYMLAAYADRCFNIRGNKVVVKRGQVAIAEQSLAERWKWARNTVHKFLNELSACGKIAQQKSRIINVLSLNYYGIVEQQNEQPYINIINKENKDNNIIIGKKKSKSSVPPTLEEVEQYIIEKGYDIDGEYLYSHYESIGWQTKRGVKIVNWKAAVDKWAKNQPKFNQDNYGNNSKSSQRDNIEEAQRAVLRDIGESIAASAVRQGEVYGILPDH